MIEKATTVLFVLALGIAIGAPGEVSSQQGGSTARPSGKGGRDSALRRAESEQRILQLAQTTESERPAGDPTSSRTGAEGNATEGSGAARANGNGQDAGAGAQAAGATTDNGSDSPGAVEDGGEAGAPGGAEANVADTEGAAGSEDEGGSTQQRIEPTPGRKGRTASISEGELDMKTFLRFLSDFTGVTVLIDGTDQGFLNRTITIVNQIDNVNEAVIKAILEVNKVRLLRDTLKDGTDVIKVEPMQPTGASAAQDPRPLPVYRVDKSRAEDDQIGTAERRELQQDEFATMVFTLQYIPPSDAIEALQRLVGGGTGAPAGRTPAVSRVSSSFSMVEIQGTQMLIITAKFGLLNYIKTLLELVDIPIPEPERIIQIKQIMWADAGEIEQIITQFIQGRTSSRFSRFSQRQVTAPRPTTAGQAATTSSSRTDDFSTKIISDIRTNQLIIETYSEQDLEDIEMLVESLDVRFNLRRARTNIYQVRYLKAVEVAQDLQMLIQGQSSGMGLSSRSTRSALSRPTSTIPRVSGTRRTTPTTPQAGGAPQNAEIPSLIVPHEPTNSLLIQAEPEDFDEIINILSKIDTKRRQVFLEAALVQVQSNSALNYAIELIAGNPDDRATRGLAFSSFGLTGVDENFNRILPFPADPGTIPPGGFFALLHRGDLPFIVRFFKQHQDSQILATPFILADDNEENRIDILETRFVANTVTQNNQTTLSQQQGEPAGITLSITPTISGSQRAVFLVMDLSVSEFQEATVAGTLPPKNENTMTSSVTIPDGTTFVVGGLTRENRSKTVQKVPILGDIPILGKLFRSENTVSSQNNLYVFLQAHILTDEDFEDGIELTEKAKEQMAKFSDSVNPIKFDRPGGKTSLERQNLKRIEAYERDDRFFQLNDREDELDPYRDPSTAFRTDGRRPGSERTIDLSGGSSDTAARRSGAGSQTDSPAASAGGSTGWILDVETGAAARPQRPPAPAREPEPASESPPPATRSRDSSGWFD